MIVVVDYGMGNVGSVANMLRKVGTEAVASADLDVIRNAPKLILPGVGAFDAAMNRLHERGLVRSVGVSNHTPAQVAALQAHLSIPLASVQPELSVAALGAVCTALAFILFFALPSDPARVIAGATGFQIFGLNLGYQALQRLTEKFLAERAFDLLPAHPFVLAL